MTKILMLPAAGILLGLAACNPYDPGDRTLGGGLIGASSGAAIGAAIGGGDWRRHWRGSRGRDWRGPRRDYGGGDHSTAASATGAGALLPLGLPRS